MSPIYWTSTVARTCRHFGISRQTFYRWQRRYDALNLLTLEARSPRPHRHRQPTWSTRLADRVLVLRQRYPRWGKDKLAVLLHQQQIPVSTSMVGRIVGQLKRHGRLREPRRSGVDRHALRARPYAIPKPKQYAVSRPGDLVQVDTLDVRPLPGKSSSSSPPAMWSRAGTSSRPTRGPPPRPLPSSWKPCCTACPFPSVRYRWMAAPPPTSSRPASTACACSFCHRDLPS